MRTRYALSVCLFLFLSIPFHSKADGYFISVFGGATKVEMKGYNDAINAANSFNASLGINSSLKRLDIGVLPDLTFGYDFNQDIGAYVRNCGIMLMDSDSKAYWANGVQAQKIKGDFSSFYTTIGVRYNIQDKTNPGFTGYVSADGGICHYYANYMEESAYKEDGGVLYSIRKDWDTAIPAGSVEAGMNWWFSGAAGLGIKAGYRLASGKVMIKITNISGWTGESQGMSTVDYSGGYLNAGVVFRFDNKDSALKNKLVPVMDGQFPEISLKLYNEASEYFDEGLFRSASEKIDQANSTAPNDERITGLKTKIDSALKSEKTETSRDKMLKQADEYRVKKQFKKARARYTEVLTMEKGNSQAEFYIKEFNGKAEECLKLARALKAAGDNEKAYKNAKLAAEYNPDDAEITGLESDLKGVVNSEKEITKKYNRAVEEFKHGRYQDAIELWDEVILANPDDKEAVENREKAVKKIEESETEKKASVDKALKQAQSLYDIGEIKEAQQKCEFVLRLAPDNEDGKKLYATILKLNEENKVEVITKR